MTLVAKIRWLVTCGITVVVYTAFAGPSSLDCNVNDVTWSPLDHPYSSMMALGAFLISTAIGLAIEHDSD